MATFTPNFTVIHNGKALVAGLPVEISDKEVNVLKDYGTIQVQKTPSKTKKEQAKKVLDDDDIL